MQTIKREVKDKVIVTTTTTTIKEDRYIDFADILDSIKVEPDDWYEKPWDNCCGFDHVVFRQTYAYHTDMLGSAINVARDRRGAYVIEFDCTTEKDFDDLYNYYRSNGASKGVANELVALSRRKRMETIVKWHEEGWDWWVVSGEYNGCAASCGAVDDYECADTEVRNDIAHDLAYQLENIGFIVTGKPDRKAAYRKNLRESLKRRISLFDWR